MYTFLKKDSYRLTAEYNLNVENNNNIFLVFRDKKKKKIIQSKKDTIRYYSIQIDK